MVVDHGATRTTYQPVAASVLVRATVAAGAAIGRLVLPGSHCFPRACLHWGWIEGETYLDPLRLVPPAVRLVPRWLDRPAIRAGPAVVLGRRLGSLMSLMPLETWDSAVVKIEAMSSPLAAQKK